MSRRAGSSDLPVPIVGTVAAEIVGLGLIAISWYGASGAVRVEAQLPWVLVGVSGLAIAGMGNAGRMVVERRRLRERGRRLANDVVAIPPSSTVTTRPAMPVSSPIMTKYHEPHCALVAGKPVQPADAATHRRAGRRPCGICRP